MKEITYNCKFCKHQRTFEVHWDETCEQMNLSRWITALACPRCSIHERRRRDLEYSARKVCCQLISDKAMLRGQAFIRAEDSARATLTQLLTRFAECVCEHVFLETQFDADFVNVLMEKPRSVSKTLSLYRSTIIKMAKQVHAQDETRTINPD